MTENRPTIADIAAAAGVSKGAVSYALNGKPGVSAATRERILAIARSLGWHPNRAARALSAGRAGAVGLLVDRPAWVLGVEPFFMQLISGLEAELARSGTALLMQAIDGGEGDREAEEAAYRAWWGERRVDGAIIVDLGPDDYRLNLAAELGMPAVAIGSPGRPLPPGVSAVSVDDGAGARETLEYLVALGHRRIARVAGPTRFLHTELRTTAVRSATRELGVPEPCTEYTDYTGEGGAHATRRLLSGPVRPTAIVYDNDVMAVAALGVAHEMGFRVPADLSLVAWDDSALCRLPHPALSAIDRRVPEYGERAAAELIRLIGGGPGFGREVRLEPPPRLVPRGSTAPLAEPGRPGGPPAGGHRERPAGPVSAGAPDPVEGE
ncbi:LacI family DNA-binding transcriptional regulator [Phaeacidiphilus oryzae]|uniref:LacI family DNA-binding transcriptional regulator n=1 Tax=Phaeacidiphilus oryzae TaxID=348818 RepID=UPI000A00F674|nr:LacI family DNA-binding transcriptional regulator [Phaeacidiphilus oryzae]